MLGILTLKALRAHVSFVHKNVEHQRTQKQWFTSKHETQCFKDIKCIRYSNHAVCPCFKLKQKWSVPSYPQHFTSSKLWLKILKITCWKQTQYRDRAESLPGKPPCTIAVPACTSRYLHSWQTFSAVSSSNPHQTQTQCLSFFWRPWAYFPEILLSLRANRLSVSIMRCHQLY